MCHHACRRVCGGGGRYRYIYMHEACWQAHYTHMKQILSIRMHARDLLAVTVHTYETHILIVSIYMYARDLLVVAVHTYETDAIAMYACERPAGSHSTHMWGTCTDTIDIYVQGRVQEERADHTQEE